VHLIATVFFLIFSILAFLVGPVRAADSITESAQAPENQPATVSSSSSSTLASAPPPGPAVVAPSESISGNPSAVNIKVGLGLVSALTGLDKLGIFLGGLWVGDGDYLIDGGIKTGNLEFQQRIYTGLSS
jgi:hypothetical protein